MSSVQVGLNLTALLQNLTKEEVMNFKSLLRVIPVLKDDQERPSWDDVDEADDTQLVDILLQKFPDDRLSHATPHILERMNRKDLYRILAVVLMLVLALGDLGAENANPCVTTEPQTILWKSIPVEKEEWRKVKAKLSSVWRKKFRARSRERKLLVNEGVLDSIPFLSPPCEARLVPCSVVLHGAAGVGKTVLACRLVLEWAGGSTGQRFQYLFYLNCRELACLEPCTLLELLSQDCPEMRGPLREVLLHRLDILFVVDDFNELGVVPAEVLGDLCGGLDERKPVPVLVSSLLGRRLLPEVALLVTTRPGSLRDLLLLLRQPLLVEVPGLLESERRGYFLNYFGPQDQDCALGAFEAMEHNSTLSRLGAAPAVCWVACVTLQLHVNSDEDPAAVCSTTTELFLRFLCGELASPGPPVRVPLHALSVLAARYLWAGRSLLPDRDLAQLGLCLADLHPLLDAQVLYRDSDLGCAFLHLSLQQFLAAVFYVLRPRDGDREAVGTIGGARQLFSRDARSSNPALALTGHFLFGLLNESRARKLETTFGCTTWLPQVRQELLGDASQGPEPLLSTLELREALGCLHESQDGALARQALAPFLGLTLALRDVSDVLHAAFCLQHCPGLKSISLRVAKGIFSRKDTSQSSTSQGARPSSHVQRAWIDLCAALCCNKNLQLLEVTWGHLNTAALESLCKHLTQATCSLQKVIIKNVSPVEAYQDICLALVSKETLTHLTVEGCEQEDETMLMLALGEILKYGRCSLQQLRVVSCSANTVQWGNLFLILQINQSLTCLDLSGSVLRDQGAKVLYSVLRHTNRVLQRLSLEDCCLTEASCKELAPVLLVNNKLTHLCLADNDLGDNGVKLLCDALCDPDCQLQELGLLSCSVSSLCCPMLAAVLRSSRTLEALDLGQNSLGLNGIATLLEALKDAVGPLRTLRLTIDENNTRIENLLKTLRDRKPQLAIERVAWSDAPPYCNFFL
ncbi:NACHT, LRR and PYD domains-containing protein 7-like [Ctenodactylus gundi]